MPPSPPSARTTASLLPLLPRIFFLYLEPVIITYGASMAHAHRLPLLAALSRSSSSSTSSSTSQPFDLAVLSAPGLSATYLICMMFYGLIILLSTPPNTRLLKLHISLLALADVAHWLVLLSTASEMSEAEGTDWLDLAAPAAWWHDDAAWWHDDAARLLVVAPLGSFCFKIATLAGVFGRIGEV